MSVSNPSCELCAESGGEVVHQEPALRVVLVDDPAYPGFCRVIWNRHEREMTDLADAERALLMNAVWKTEQAVRVTMQPDKINLASLGNVVPHLHWHVIPRYQDDQHFPAPIWAQPQRQGTEEKLRTRRAMLDVLREELKRLFA
jgi:diadenosine tetraphosphate (Ap4A) HIT family hydrolase